MTLRHRLVRVGIHGGVVGSVLLVALAGHDAAAHDEPTPEAPVETAPDGPAPPSSTSAVSGAPSASAEPSSPAVDRSAQNAVFLELFGNGIAYSINYDRMVSEVLSLRVGTGLVASFGSTFAMGNLLLGSASHKMELGAGPIVGYGSDFDRGFALAMTTTLGYRYVPWDGGFFFKAAFTPVIALGRGGGFLPWGGISFGAAF